MRNSTPLSTPFSNKVKKDVFSNLNGNKSIADNSTEPKSSCPINEYVPPFPLKVFPKSIQDIIIEAHRVECYPIDFLAASILFAFSVALGNTFNLEQKKGSNWYETPVLWIAIIGDVSVNKSHPLKFALSPILNYEKKAYMEFQSEMAHYEEILSVPFKERMGATPTKPKRKQYLIQDSTQETIAPILEQNKRGIGVYFDEIIGWLSGFNKYRSGSDEQAWLSMWSKAAIIINRMTSKSYYIDNPFVSVIGTTQTENIGQLLKGSKSKNGFFERLLIVFPDNIVKKPWSHETLTEELKNRYKNYIEKGLNFEYFPEEGSSSNKTLYYSDKAKQLIFDWQNHNTERINKTEDSRIKGILGKIETYIVRFCLLIQIIDDIVNDNEPSEISSDSAIKAMSLAEYFESNAKKVIQMVSEETPIDELTSKTREWYSRLPNEQFKTSLAIETGKANGMSEKTVYNYLNKKNLFNRISQGVYGKLW